MTSRFVTRVAAACLGAGAVFAWTVPASAGLLFCNDTETSATVAIGYKGDEGWTSEGWWSVPADECTIVVGGELTRGYYYWRAIDENGSYQADNYYFCTSDEVFTIVGDTNCVERGYEREGFSEVEIDADGDVTVRLTAALAPEPPADRKTAEPAPDTGVDPEPRKTSEPREAPNLEPEPSTPARAYDFPQIKADLQGVWRDADNRSTTMTIDGDRLEDLYLGDTSFAGSWRLAGTCAGAGGRGPVMLVTYDEIDDETLCWILEELNQTEMRFRAVASDEPVYLIKD